MSTRRRNTAQDETAAPATGADYIAIVRLSTKQNETLAAEGETCDRVPDASLPWLLEQGLIIPKPAPSTAGDERVEGEAR